MLFVSALVLGFYAWARFIPTGYDLPLGLVISDIAAIFASVTLVVSVVLCFWLPKAYPRVISTALYALAAMLVSILIFTSGGTGSPFISMWLVVAIFAGFFGAGAVIGMSLLAVAQVLVGHGEQPMALPLVVGHLVFGIAPVALGAILWHRQPTKKKDNSFRDLANKLSTVEGKSDVVISSIDDGVISIDRSGTIDLINPAAQTLLGWNKGDALGLDWHSVLKLADHEGREVDATNNPIEQSLSSSTPVHDDTLQLITNSDKKRLVSIVSSPIGQGDGGVIVVFRDVTKEKAEEREQAEFISTASHEMRTPVASIEGYLGLALNPATAAIDDKARDYITKAHQSAKHLGELFQNLLDISKAEDGRLKNSPEVIDVVAMLGDIFEGLEPLAREKGLRYLYKPNPSLDTDSSERKLQPVFYTHVDPAHLREVAMNLIENAIKYTPQGDVTVDVTGDDRFVTVSIQDSGIGIPTEDIPHLFQKFYRVDNTDTREIGGTGLGLYLCRRLAEAMGGGVRVESTYQQGSTFFLDIPRISHEDAMELMSKAAEEGPTIAFENSHAMLAEAPAPEPEESAPESIPLSSAPATLPPPPVVQIPITTPPPQPAPEPLPERIEVTASSGADLEFKIPEQFQDLPFQDMTLADIDEAVRSQPVFEHSGFQPLNILPEPAPQPPTPQPQPTTAAPTRQPASRSTYFPTTRPQAVGMPTRPSQ